MAPPSFDDQAVAEKVYAAERNVAIVRFAVVAVNSLFYLLLMEKSGTIPWLAYTIIGVAGAYSAGTILFEPYRHFPVVLTSYFTSISDAGLITFWILATGVFSSPFFMLWYVSIAAIAFRYDLRETLVVSVGYGLAYGAMLAFAGELTANLGEWALQSLYIVFVGALGGLLAEETLAQSRGRERMRALMEETREAKEELERSQAHLRTVVEGAPIILFALDPGGTITFSDGRGLSALGLEPHEAVGNDAFEMYADFPEVLDALDAALEGEQLRVELDLGDVVLDTWYQPVFGPDGEVERVVGVSTDVTQRARVLRELEVSNQELERYALVASHDLRSPLRTVGSYVQLLERRYGEDLPEEAREYIEFARDGVERMDAIVKDLLSYAQLQSGDGHARLVDPEQVLASVLADLDGTIESTGGTVHVEEALPVVEVDPTHLAQVLTNLLSNALKFHRPDVPPEVEVDAREEDGMVAFRITDNGMGIPERHRDRVFDIFQRLHPKSGADGTGIGLAIVKRIVESYGGEVSIETAPGGEGTTFRFTLPAAP